MPDQVILTLALPLASTLETLIVIVVLVTVAVALVRARGLFPVPPASLVTVAVTVLAVLNTNPEGAFRILVPGVLTSRFAPSINTGPLKGVQDVLPVVSAEIALPP